MMIKKSHLASPQDCFSTRWRHSFRLLFRCFASSGSVLKHTGKTPNQMSWTYALFFKSMLLFPRLHHPLITEVILIAVYFMKKKKKRNTKQNGGKKRPSDAEVVQLVEDCMNLDFFYSSRSPLDIVEVVT